ncbi:hypothetical protein [Azospirillum argentinense]
MIDRNAALGQHLLKVAVADAISAVPAHRPEHDLTLEVATFEVRHSLAPSKFQPFRCLLANFATEASEWSSENILQGLMRGTCDVSSNVEHALRYLSENSNISIFMFRNNFLLQRCIR